MTALPYILLAAVAGAAAAPAVLAMTQRSSMRPRRLANRATPAIWATTVTLCSGITALGTWRWGPLTALTILPPLLLLASPAVLVDWREQRLPGVLTMPFALIAVLTAGIPALISTRDVSAAVAAIVTAAVCGLILLGVGLYRPRLIGLGDIILSLGLSAYLGAAGRLVLYAGLLLCLWLVAATAILLRHTRVGGRVVGDDDEDTPYGPALLVGTLTALVAFG